MIKIFPYLPASKRRDMYRGRADLLSRGPISPDDLIKVAESALMQLGVPVPMSLMQISRMVNSKIQNDDGAWIDSNEMEEKLGEVYHDPVTVYLVAYYYLLRAKETAKSEPRKAFDALAIAAMGLVHGTALLPLVSVAQGGQAKAAKATGRMKAAIKKEWVSWQADRSKYRYPRDFRRAMMLKFPDVVDGTLKNWMSKWARGNG